MNSREQILVLDGHTNQGLACVRSLGRKGYELLVASHLRIPLGAWSRYCCRRFRLEGQTIEAFAALREWAQKQGTKIILPLTERSCLLCNAERQEWEALGITIGCGPDEMLIQAFDKAQTLREAENCGVRIPRTRIPESLAEYRAAGDEIGFPCVVKPRWSNAWNGNGFLPDLGPCYVSDREELLKAALGRKQGDYWPMIQEYVPGQGKGVFALCDRSRVVAWFAHERLRDVKPTGSGSSLRRSIRLEPRLRAPAERLLTELKWHGPAMVEFRDDGKNSPCLMEVNGRFWGSLQLGIDAGVDFPRLWLAILSGENFDPPPDYAEGVTLRWLWGDIERLLHILAGPPSGYTAPYPTLRQGVKELLGSQPVGTHLEMWQSDDPRPAIGEWLEGVRGVVASYRSLKRAEVNHSLD